MADNIRWGLDNPHPFSQMKTELIWEGKYDEYGNRRAADIAGCAMPLQKIETVDEPASRAHVQDKLFDPVKAHQDDFRNQLVWGDNKLVMASLLKEFKGKIDLIYIDPPFDVGADFTMNVPVGDGKETLGKDQSALEMVAYRDMWGKGTDSYLQMMYERLVLIRDLLNEKGTVYIHCDWRVNFFIRSLIDDVFSGMFLNEIIWAYFAFKRSTARKFPQKHDTILSYRKSNTHQWTTQYKPHKPEYLKRFKKDKIGYDRYPKKGKYTACIKVIDVFGCDTSITVEIVL